MGVDHTIPASSGLCKLPHGCWLCSETFYENEKNLFNFFKLERKMKKNITENEISREENAKVYYF